MLTGSLVIRWMSGPERPRVWRDALGRLREMQEPGVTAVAQPQQYRPPAAQEAPAGYFAGPQPVQQTMRYSTATATEYEAGPMPNPIPAPAAATSAASYSDGLPLARPGQQLCFTYMQTGTCRFGPNCRFQHPPDRKAAAVAVSTAVNPAKNGPSSSRAGGYAPSKAELEAMDPDALPAGDRWSVRKCYEQLRDALIIDAAIFVVNEAITAYSMTYWRPVMWSVAWISLTILVSGFGFFALQARSTMGLLGFTVLQLMFSAINLQHLNMAHSEAVRSCYTHQYEFKHCDVPSLSHCIKLSECSLAEMGTVDPPCHAPGHMECEQFANMDMMFWLNQMINFFTYAEPCFWALMLVFRLEMTMQSEGPNTTAYRKLLRGRDLQLVGPQQGYNSVGASFIAVASIIVLGLTIDAGLHS